MKNNIVYILIFISIFIIGSCQTSLQKHTDNKIRVAVFNGNGSSVVCQIETLESLKIDTAIVAEYISAQEISAGKLENFDAIIFPGGSASKELNNLGHIAGQKVKEFIAEGHGAVGICAGGYLFSTTKGYPSLRLVSATEWDREHYNKGRALVEFELTKMGETYFPELANNKCFMQYYDGPVLMPSDSNLNGEFKYTEIAKYITDIQIHKNYPANVTPGKTFLLTEAYKKGLVMVIAGHPESTPGMRWMVPRMVRVVTQNSIIKYDNKWVRPDIYSQEILFNTELTRKEKTLFWNLLDTDGDKKIEAMHELWRMHSRPAVRWNMGLLRDSIPLVRAAAATLLMQAEYSAAIPDLKQASVIEKDSLAKEKIDKAINYLSEF